MRATITVGQLLHGPTNTLQNLIILKESLYLDHLITNISQAALSPIWMSSQLLLAH